MTLQEIFDHVTRHLITQGKAAASEGGLCYYRAPDGTKCAVGCLIPDERYHPDMEGRGVANALIMEALGLQRDTAAASLLGQLQSAHDLVLNKHGMEAWKVKMRNIARTFDLEIPSA